MPLGHKPTGNIGLQGIRQTSRDTLLRLGGSGWIDVDVHFSADLTPEVAEGVVFRQVAFAFGIDHAVEEAVSAGLCFPGCSRCRRRSSTRG